MRRECPKRDNSRIDNPSSTQISGNVRNDNKGKAKARAYRMTEKEAEETPDVITGTFLVNNLPARVLFDCGASRSCVSSTFAHLLNMNTTELKVQFEVELVDVYLGSDKCLKSVS